MKFFYFLILIMTISLGGCAQTVQLKSELKQRQASAFDNGRETIISKKRYIVAIAPKKSSLSHSKKIEFGVLVYNSSYKNIKFSPKNIKLVEKKKEKDKTIKLEVFTYNELIKQADNKKSFSTVLTALSGVAQGLSAVGTGYQEITGTSYNPNIGTTYHKASTYNSALAQANLEKAFENTSKNLEEIKKESKKTKKEYDKFIIKEKTIKPKYWYGGKILVQAPDRQNLPCEIIFRIKVDKETHEIKYNVQK